MKENNLGNMTERPFEVIASLEREAEQKFRAKEQELLAAIEETETKIRALQKQRLLSAADAKKGGLIDDVVAWKGARNIIGKDDGATFKRRAACVRLPSCATAQK